VITVFNDTVESEGEANEIAREINHMAESIDEIPLFEAGHGEINVFCSEMLGPRGTVSGNVHM
jgi:hypothetical protein